MNGLPYYRKEFKGDMERLTISGTKEAKPDVTIREALNKLAEYEDLEEQGKLLELPCAVGDTVYRVNIGAKEPIIHMEVCEVGIISLKEKGYVIQIMCRDEVGNGETYYLGTDFGKAVFFTEPEAEQALEEIRE